MGKDNPLDTFEMMFAEQLKEMDAKKPVNDYKRLTDTFVKYIETKCKVHVIDLEYGDGYFIFTNGSNSTIEFKIKECHNWLFGIWWNYDKKYDEISFDFFTQYIPTIDKFKPSRSYFCENGNIEHMFVSDIILEAELVERKKNKNLKIDSLFSSSAGTVEYIKKYPARAYYNSCYERSITEFIAKFILMKDTIERFEEENINELFLKKIVKAVKKYIIPMYNDGVISNNGENCSPRYEVVVPFSKNEGAFGMEQCGSYYIEENDKTLGYYKVDKIYKRISKYADIINKIRRKIYIHGHNEFDYRYVYMCDEERFEKFFKEEKDGPR